MLLNIVAVHIAASVIQPLVCNVLAYNYLYNVPLIKIISSALMVLFRKPQAKTTST